MDQSKWNIPNIPGRFDHEKKVEPAQPQPSKPASLELDGLELDPLLPDTVRAIRRALKLTQDQLATWAGVSVRAVKAWEHRGDSTESRPCAGTARKCLVLLAHDPSLIEVV